MCVEGLDLHNSIFIPLEWVYVLLLFFRTAARWHLLKLKVLQKWLFLEAPHW